MKQSDKKCHDTVLKVEKKDDLHKAREKGSEKGENTKGK
jgi:hypothetical protein